MQLVLHAPFGARINRAWGLALRKRFCRSFNFELQAAATDNGIVISLSDQHSFPLELVFEFLSKETVEDVLTQAMLDAPMFEARWRWDTSRALAVLRFAGGRKVPPPIQRMRSDDLLAAVFPDQAACQENIVGDIRIPDHPLVNETIKDCLHEAMDLDGLKRLVERIGSGAHQDRRDRHARAVAVLARDSQRQSVRLSGRCAAGGAASARRADAAHDWAGRRRRRGARSGGDRRSGGRIVARRARCGRAARCAADADRRAAGGGMGGVFRHAARVAARHGAERGRRELLGRGRAAEVGAAAVSGRDAASRRSTTSIARRHPIGSRRRPKRCAAGSSRRAADAERTVPAICAADRSDGGGAPAGSKPRGRFCAAGSRRRLRRQTARSSGATGACSRAFIV